MKHLFDRHLDLEELTCEHKNFFNSGGSTEQLCNITKTQCAYQHDFINFFSMCYCYLDGSWVVATIFCFLFIFMNFRFISAVVEEYLAPSIAYISEAMKLSEALGAVTLLALANGAGDVIVALVASGSEGGLAYNVGAIYGAGLFVCSIVVAMTINNSKTDIKVEFNTLWRDVGFYIISTVVIIVFAIIGELTMVSCSIMLGIYVLLVLVVWVQERFIVKEEIENKETEIKEKDVESKQKDPDAKAKQLDQLDLIYLPEDKTEEELKVFPKKWHNTLSRLNTASNAQRMKIMMNKFKSTALLLMKMKQKSLENEIPFGEKEFFDKILYIMDYPFDLMRKATLPPCESEKYNKFQATIFPIPGILFFYFLHFSINLWVVLAIILVGSGISYAIHVTSKENDPPSYYLGFQIFGAIGALNWTYVVCGILIDILQFLGMISKLNKTYLGLTVIAVGNALPDAVTTIALAKQGYAIMGLTGAYGKYQIIQNYLNKAGQLFGLLVGLGLALLKKTYAEGPQKFDLFNPDEIEQNFMNIFVILISLLNLLITFIYGILSNYNYTKTLAKVLATLYLFFVAISTIIAFRSALIS